jgi:hypothetical protein
MAAFNNRIDNIAMSSIGPAVFYGGAFFFAGNPQKCAKTKVMYAFSLTH